MSIVLVSDGEDGGQRRGQEGKAGICEWWSSLGTSLIGCGCSRNAYRKLMILLVNKRKRFDLLVGML